MELKFDLFLYYTAWICWHFNFAINVWDHKLLWYFIYKLWTLYNFCHAGCWHILLWIKKKMCCQRPVKWFLLCVHSVLILQDSYTLLHCLSTSRCQQTQTRQYTTDTPSAVQLSQMNHHSDLVNFPKLNGVGNITADVPVVHPCRSRGKQLKQTTIFHTLLRYLCVTSSLI